MNIATIRSTITEHEGAQVERANAANATPIVFVHGLCTLQSVIEIVKTERQTR